MTARYSITNDENFSGATVVVDGEVYTVDSRQPTYPEIVKHLINNVDDDETLLGLITPVKLVSDTLTRLTERVTYRDGSLYFDGDVLESAIATHIVRIIETDATNEVAYLSLVRFLEKVATNPSKKSRKHLYHFVESNGMTIHEDGDLIAYKGVRTDGYSSHSGYGIVDGKIFGEINADGELVKGESLLNNVGSVIEIPRSLVDDDRQQTCSTGLHVGTYSYARSFAPKLLTVKVNPRDVVSVPHDYDNSKVRVSRYLVLEENNGEYTNATLEAKDDKDFTQDVPDADFDEKSVDLKDNYEAPGDLVEVDDDNELSDEEIKRNAKIDAFVLTIKGLQDSELRRHRNKRVTAKNRPLFDVAVAKSGRVYPA
jgi:hypothetical protein